MKKGCHTVHACSDLVKLYKLSQITSELETSILVESSFIVRIATAVFVVALCFWCFFFQLRLKQFTTFNCNRSFTETALMIFDTELENLSNVSVTAQFLKAWSAYVSWQEMYLFSFSFLLCLLARKYFLVPKYCMLAQVFFEHRSLLGSVLQYHELTMCYYEIKVQRLKCPIPKSLQGLQLVWNTQQYVFLWGVASLKL